MTPTYCIRRHKNNSGWIIVRDGCFILPLIYATIIEAYDDLVAFERSHDDIVLEPESLAA